MDEQETSQEQKPKKKPSKFELLKKRKGGNV